MNAYTYLAIAICAEVIATASMKAVKGLSTPLPLLLVIVGYGVAFWMLTLVVRSMPVGLPTPSGRGWALCWSAWRRW
jgi:small multidrug resistance pump